MKCILNIFLGLTLVTHFSSCCRDADDLPVHRLDTAAKAWTEPYKQSEFFNFKNVDGESKSYQVDSIKTNTYEHGGFELECSKFKYEMWRAWMHQVGDTLNRISMFEVSVPDDKKGYLEWDDFQHNVTIQDYEEGKIANGSQVEYVQQLEVNEKIYTGLLLLKKLPTTSAPLPTSIEKVYYDKAHGVVRFDFFNGEQWLRVE